MNGKSLRCNAASLEEASVNAIYPSKKFGDHIGLGLKGSCSAAYHAECKTVNDNVKKHTEHLIRLYRRLLKYTSPKLYTYVTFWLQSQMLISRSVHAST